MEQYRPLPSFGGLPTVSFLDAKVIIISYPLEITTTYKKGTREAPQAILSASYNIELYDEELDDIPADIGIYTFPDLLLPLGNLDKSLQEIEKVTLDILKHNKLPIFLGGEHTITKAIIKAYSKVYEDFSILHLDAHADLRLEYEGTNNNHACALRDASERFHLVQVGVRSLSQEERNYIKGKSNIKVFWDHVFSQNYSDLILKEIIDNLKRKVYITLDFDVFNPAEMPAVGTPEPGGLSWYQILSIIKEVFKYKEVIGVDLVEFSPIPGLIYPDYLAARLLYKIIGYYKKYQLGF